MCLWARVSGSRGISSLAWGQRARSAAVAVEEEEVVVVVMVNESSMQVKTVIGIVNMALVLVRPLIPTGGLITEPMKPLATDIKPNIAMTEGVIILTVTGIQPLVHERSMTRPATGTEGPAVDPPRPRLRLESTRHIEAEAEVIAAALSSSCVNW